LEDYDLVEFAFEDLDEVSLVLIVPLVRALPILHKPLQSSI